MYLKTSLLFLYQSRPFAACLDLPRANVFILKCLRDACHNSHDHCFQDIGHFTQDEYENKHLHYVVHQYHVVMPSIDK